jgi:hypothetical protein
MFEGNDYIGGLIGITSDVLIKKRLSDDDNILEYTKKLKSISKTENFIRSQYINDVNLFHHDIESYTSLHESFYETGSNNINMTFIDFIRTF